MTHSTVAMPTLDWSQAPDWAILHIYQPWGAGVWTDDNEPYLGNFAHNHGRWWFAQNAKTKASNYMLPVGIDYRESMERRPTTLLQNRPTIVCLCGSTRFSQAYQQANLQETLAGNIVLTIGCDMRSDQELWEGKTPEELDETKRKLDELHLWKVWLADEVLILNVGQYVGESTARELAYARSLSKKIRFWEETILVDTKAEIET